MIGGSSLEEAAYAAVLPPTNVGGSLKVDGGSLGRTSYLLSTFYPLLSHGEAVWY